MNGHVAEKPRLGPEPVFDPTESLRSCYGGIADGFDSMSCYHTKRHLGQSDHPTSSRHDRKHAVASEVAAAAAAAADLENGAAACLNPPYHAVGIPIPLDLVVRNP